MLQLNLNYVCYAVSTFLPVQAAYILTINLSHNNVYAAPTTFTPILSKTAYLNNYELDLLFEIDCNNPEEQYFITGSKNSNQNV